MATAERDTERALEQTTALKHRIRELEAGQRRGGVNMEYLKNVVVQFMTFPAGSAEQRALVPVLATLLQFNRRDVRAACLAPLAPLTPARACAVAGRQRGVPVVVELDGDVDLGGRGAADAAAPRRSRGPGGRVRGAAHADAAAGAGSGGASLGPRGSGKQTSSGAVSRLAAVRCLWRVLRPTEGGIERAFRGLVGQPPTTWQKDAVCGGRPFTPERCCILEKESSSRGYERPPGN